MLPMGWSFISFYVDLNEKLSQREEYYNLRRRNEAFHGQTPYEVLRQKLKAGIFAFSEV